MNLFNHKIFYPLEINYDSFYDTLNPNRFAVIFPIGVGSTFLSHFALEMTAGWFSPISLCPYDFRMCFPVVVDCILPSPAPPCAPSGSHSKPRSKGRRWRGPVAQGGREDRRGLEGWLGTVGGGDQGLS